MPRDGQREARGVVVLARLAQRAGRVGDDVERAGAGTILRRVVEGDLRVLAGSEGRHRRLAARGGRRGIAVVEARHGRPARPRGRRCGRAPSPGPPRPPARGSEPGSAWPQERRGSAPATGAGRRGPAPSGTGFRPSCRRRAGSPRARPSPARPRRPVPPTAAAPRGRAPWRGACSGCCRSHRRGSCGPGATPRPAPRGGRPLPAPRSSRGAPAGPRRSRRSTSRHRPTAGQPPSGFARPERAFTARWTRASSGWSRARSARSASAVSSASLAKSVPAPKPPSAF